MEFRIEELRQLSQMLGMIEDALHEQPPVLLSNETRDALQSNRKNIKRWVEQLEQTNEWRKKSKKKTVTTTTQEQHHEHE
jgi:hypothetical protein